MTTMEIYEGHYQRFCEFMLDETTKYEWAAGEIFRLVTYDGGLDEMFVKKILEVCKVILDKKTYEYIEDENNYVTYILVCQLLNQFHWINWGTSIRGAWFDSYSPDIKFQPIIEFNMEPYGMDKLRFSLENLKALIEFIEK